MKEMPSPSQQSRSIWLSSASRRSLPIALALAAATTLAACSFWSLGPEPDNYVGPGGPPRSLTDASLQAVTPVVPGDNAGGGALLPATAIPSTMQGLNPTTMPASTQPTTTQPAGQAGGGAGVHPETRPSLGQGGTPATAPTEVPQALSIQEAILVSLQNNVDLRIQRFNVPINRTREQSAIAAFDPDINGSISGGRTQGAIVPARTIPADPPTVPLPIVIPGSSGITDSVDASIGYSQFLPTGTQLSATLSSTNSFYSDAKSTLNGSVSVTQSLLRGAGLDVNLAAVREAEINTKISQYALRAFTEQQVADVETDYWDLAFDERQVLIVQNAVDVAEKQLADTTRRVEVGTVSRSELPASQAEVARRREDLINAKSSLERDRLTLMRRLTPSAREFWSRSITLTTLPFIPIGAMDPVENHVNVALKMRTELNEAKLRIQNGDLEVVRTRNGLLPRLDLFLTLGKTSFANAFGNSLEVFSDPGYSAVAGVNFDLNPTNRSQLASYRASLLSRDQLEETFNNLIQTVELDVRTQYIEVERTRQQIDATRATRVAQEATLQVAQGKLAAGNGTSLDVAIAQRDLLSDQLSEVQAVTDHLKALVTLYRLEGSLLLRRGLHAPGEKPIEGVAWTVGRR
jgi:outer membrane protein TolC